MKRFVEGTDRGNRRCCPNASMTGSNKSGSCDRCVRRVAPSEATGRASYHPSVLLKLYIYGCLSRVQSSRRPGREAGRNFERYGCLAAFHKTVADLWKDNGPAIRKVCARSVELCRKMGLLAKASVAVDGSKFKAVNNRDKNSHARKWSVAGVGREHGAFSEPARYRRPAGAIDKKTTHLRGSFPN